MKHLRNSVLTVNQTVNKVIISGYWSVWSKSLFQEPVYPRQGSQGDINCISYSKPVQTAQCYYWCFLYHLYKEFALIHSCISQVIEITSLERNRQLHSLLQTRERSPNPEKFSMDCMIIFSSLSTTLAILAAYDRNTSYWASLREYIAGAQVKA